MADAQPRKLACLLATPIVVAALQALWYSRRLPAIVASHFDFAGNPNGWSSREAFLTLSLGSFGATTAFLVEILLALPRIPKSLINLPNRNYWLAPERRSATFADLRRRLAWFVFATQVFLIAVFQLAIDANLAEEVRLRNEHLFALLGSYLAFTVGWVVLFYGRFRRRRERAPTEAPADPSVSAGS